MKVKLELGILLIVFLLSSYLIYNYVDSDTKHIVTNEEIRFKEEYEKLNGVYNEKTNNYYLNVNILENNNVKYKNVNEIIDILKSGTGVIYFGFPECPWCRNLVPVLVNTLNEYTVPFYYYNAYDIRDNKHLDENGNIVVDKEGTEEYYELVDVLKDYLGEYSGLNDSSIKRLYFPTIVFVKEGKILYTHIGTLDSQENPYIELSEEQQNELSNIISKYATKVYDVVCDDQC